VPSAVFANHSFFSWMGKASGNSVFSSKGSVSPQSFRQSDWRAFSTASPPSICKCGRGRVVNNVAACSIHPRKGHFEERAEEDFPSHPVEMRSLGQLLSWQTERAKKCTFPSGIVGWPRSIRQMAFSHVLHTHSQAVKAKQKQPFLARAATHWR